MPHYPQSMPDNIAYLQAQINRQGTAPLGPVSVEPGEGYLRFNNGSADTFVAQPSGAQVRFRGGLQSVSARFENDASAIEGHTAALAAHDGRITVNKNRNDAQDGILDGHNTRITVNKNRNDAQDSILDAHNSRITTAQAAANAAASAASTAQSRADAAHTLASGRATVSSVTTAQDRANAAYTLAEGRVTDAELAVHITRLTNAIKKVAANTGTPDPFLP